MATLPRLESTQSHSVNASCVLAYSRDRHHTSHPNAVPWIPLKTDRQHSRSLRPFLVSSPQVLRYRTLHITEFRVFLLVSVDGRRTVLGFFAKPHRTVFPRLLCELVALLNCVSLLACSIKAKARPSRFQLCLGWNLLGYWLWSFYSLSVRNSLV